MRRVSVWIIVGLVAAIGAGAALWPAPARAPRTLRVIFTGEVLGELEPCKCSGEEAGGLPALGGFLAEQAGEPLLVDTGCLGAGARDFEVLRLQAVLRGMAVMGYDAANVGEHEIWLGAELLREQFDLGVPFVSANVSNTSGEAVAARWRTVQKGRCRVAVTGLADPTYRGPGLRLDDPREALARILPELRGGADAVVALADLGQEAVRALAVEFPEVALILFRGRDDSRLPERVNQTVIASVAGHARFVGEVTLTWPEDGASTFEGSPALLDERFPRDTAVQQASIGWYKAAIEGREFQLGQLRPGWRRLAPSAPPAGDGYVGSAACRQCHLPSHLVWERSEHAKAMETLVEAGYAWSPECIVCHVVGYGASDGYVSRSRARALADVGCEACHGRGNLHVESKGKKLGSIVRSGEATCVRCHTPAHSRGFVYEQAWPAIAHTEEPRKDTPTRETSYEGPASRGSRPAGPLGPRGARR
jgi:hypothetical protein